MITTVTLNVAVDKAYVLESVLQAGTVSRVKTCSNTAGGKGLNVAKVVKLCQEDVIATGFAGGHNGDYVIDLLNRQQVPSRFVSFDGETRCCINVLAADGTTTEFLEPGAQVTAENIQELYEVIKELAADSEVVTISGSVPQGVSTEVYKNLIRIVKEAGKKVILDTSGQLLAEGVKAAPTMIKPNNDEIEALLGISVTNREELIEGAKKLFDGGIPYVVISLGGEGALVVCEEGIFQGKPPKIEVVNTVGCGDSMIAAFAVGFKRGYSICETLRYAVAVSAANAMTLQTGGFDREDMEKILPQVEIISF